MTTFRSYTPWPARPRIQSLRQFAPGAIPRGAARDFPLLNRLFVNETHSYEGPAARPALFTTVGAAAAGPIDFHPPNPNGLAADLLTTYLCVYLGTSLDLAMGTGRPGRGRSGNLGRGF